MKLETPDRIASTGPLHARDVMTSEVVTVGPDEPITGVAQHVAGARHQCRPRDQQ